MPTIGRLAGRVDVIVDTADVRDFLINDPGIRRDLDDRATRVQNAARRMVRKNTGLLAATIRKNPGYLASGPYVDIIAGKTGLTPYMWFEHEGTTPHVIRPRKAKALRFPVGGAVVFATKVNHPGTQGTKFLERALPFASG